MATEPATTDQKRLLLRYNNGAVTLHWLTVLLVLVQLCLGFAFAEMERGPARSELFLWHKTVGATILVVSLFRLAWRLMHKPPPFPESLPRWERVAAVWNHRIFYLLLIALPVTGLAAISAGHSGMTTVVGGVPLPLIPGLPESAGDGLGLVHGLLVLTLLALLALHMAAAVKHQFIDHAAVSGRMPPFRAPRKERVEAFDR